MQAVFSKCQIVILIRFSDSAYMKYVISVLGTNKKVWKLMYLGDPTFGAWLSSAIFEHFFRKICETQIFSSQYAPFSQVSQTLHGKFFNVQKQHAASGEAVYGLSCFANETHSIDQIT